MHGRPCNGYTSIASPTAWSSLQVPPSIMSFRNSSAPKRVAQRGQQLVVLLLLEVFTRQIECGEVRIGAVALVGCATVHCHANGQSSDGAPVLPRENPLRVGRCNDGV